MLDADANDTNKNNKYQKLSFNLWLRSLEMALQCLLDFKSPVRHDSCSHSKSMMRERDARMNECGKHKMSVCVCKSAKSDKTKRTTQIGIGYRNVSISILSVPFLDLSHRISFNFIWFTSMLIRISIRLVIASSQAPAHTHCVNACAIARARGKRTLTCSICVIEYWILSASMSFYVNILYQFISSSFVDMFPQSHYIQLPIFVWMERNGTHGYLFGFQFWFFTHRTTYYWS